MFLNVHGLLFFFSLMANSFELFSFLAIGMTICDQTPPTIFELMNFASVIFEMNVHFFHKLLTHVLQNH